MNKKFVIALIIFSIYFATSCKLNTRNKPNNHIHTFWIMIKDFSEERITGNFFRITQDSIKIYSPIFHESYGKDNENYLVYSKKIEQNDVNEFLCFIENKLLSLDSTYINYAIKDGLYITMDIQFNGNKKTIIVSNMYDKDIDEFISIINKVTPNEYKIEYSPEVVPGF